VVLDYSLIIPKQIIDYFEFGILNSHFSLLPKYRGPNPIRTAILNGDKLTGVTVIRITPELDDGPILTWAEITIECMNAIELREQLSNINCALLPETVKLYLNNELELISQDESQAIYTTKTTKDDGKLEPAKSAEQLEREVRAYAGWPKSYFDYRGKTYIVHKAVANSIKVPAGELRAINKKLYYGCKNGSLEILEIQPASKPRMNAQAFINGYQI
jgi:methionyl-tRNA formyltransferase